MKYPARGCGFESRALRSKSKVTFVFEGDLFSLTRQFATGSGLFHADHAISLDFLEKLTHSAAAFEHLHPVLSALDDIPALPISRAEATKLRHGQKLPTSGALAQQRFVMLMTGGTAIAVEGQTPVALVILKAGAICPVRVLNL